MLDVCILFYDCFTSVTDKYQWLVFTTGMSEVQVTTQNSLLVMPKHFVLTYLSYAVLKQ